MVEYSPQPPSARGPSGEWCNKWVKSVSSILKMVEMVLAFMALVASAILVSEQSRNLGWVIFTSLTGLIQVVISFIIHIINYFPDMTLALVIEMIVYLVYTLFFFGAGINSAVLAADIGKTRKLIGQSQLFRHQTSRWDHLYATAIVATLCCFACLVVWGVDTVLQLLHCIKKRQQPAQQPTQPYPPPQ